jgi:hypothetical protein
MTFGYRIRMMTIVSVEVDIDLDEFSSDQLMKELTDRNYLVNGTVSREDIGFTTEDLNLLIEIIDQTPETIYSRRVRDKLFYARFTPSC